MTAYAAFYVTCLNEEQARTIGRALVENKLAACVSIIPQMGSIYEWQGELVEQHEAALVIKSTLELAEPMTHLILSLHSYECPCIVAWPIAWGHPAYLRWIDEQTA